SPEVRSVAAEPDDRSLFEPLETEQDRQGRGRRFVAGAGFVDLLLVAALTVAARRRHASAAPGVAVIAGLLSLSVASTLILLAFMATVGLSLGAILISLLAGSVALLVAGLVAA